VSACGGSSCGRLDSFFLGFAGYSSKPPFDPSMMVHFRKRFSEEELSRINELIAERGKAMVMEAVAAQRRRP
jgi:transposase, IS5 family